MPIGIIGYYASVSNVFLRWLIKLYGLDTSKDEGIYKIEDAATNSDWAWIEASGILSFIYLWIENKPEDAIPITKKLTEEFPNNFYFNILSEREPWLVPMRIAVPLFLHIFTKGENLSDILINSSS